MELWDFLPIEVLSMMAFTDHNVLLKLNKDWVL